MPDLKTIKAQLPTVAAILIACIGGLLFFLDRESEISKEVSCNTKDIENIKAGLKVDRAERGGLEEFIISANITIAIMGVNIENLTKVVEEIRDDKKHEIEWRLDHISRKKDLVVESEG